MRAWENLNMKMNPTERARALVAELQAEVVRAALPDPTDRIFTPEQRVKQARDKEWATLWSALMLPSMRDVFNGDIVAERLDVLRREILARCNIEVAKAKSAE